MTDTTTNAKSRHGLASSTVGENIYLIGGGVIPGFSFSAITEKYHNTIVPEFGMLSIIVLSSGMGMMIYILWNKKTKFKPIPVKL